MHSVQMCTLIYLQMCIFILYVRTYVRTRKIFIQPDLTWSAARCGIVRGLWHRLVVKGCVAKSTFSKAPLLWVALSFCSHSRY